MVKKKIDKATTFYVVLIALFSALVCVLTIFVRIPWGKGYINFGDTLIFLAASLLGPVGGMIAGAIGSSLADLFSGFATYAPFTFVVKGGEGFLCGILYTYVFRKQRPMLRRLFSMLIAGAWMIIGYFLTDLMLYGWEASLFNFVSGPIQAGASLVVALIVMPRVPVLFESVKHHTDNDEEELYAEIEEKKAAQAGSSADTRSDEENTDTENNNKSDTDKE
ncbi:MAG TPA: ECF transporter S component [Clostridiales bacterium]|nr:ECF transporter S component [Clostridiales bacterium]